MIVYEDRCVMCPPEMGCLGNDCPKLHVPVHQCDICRRYVADYQIDGEDYCETCAKKYIQDAFDDLSLQEKADLLHINLKYAED